MTDEYKEMVKKAWKMLDIEQYDSRSFLEALQDLIDERDALQEWKDDTPIEKGGLDDWNY